MALRDCLAPFPLASGSTFLGLFCSGCEQRKQAVKVAVEECKHGSLDQVSSEVCAGVARNSPPRLNPFSRVNLNLSGLARALCSLPTQSHFHPAVTPRIFFTATAPASNMTPNPSLKLTRYGRLCKPGLRYSVHSLSPGLQSLPPRAA